MCGITGIVNLAGEPIDQALLANMTASLAHRGPDGQGLWFDGAVGLGHRRLTIVDLSDNGSQPMVNERGDVVVVFNGEIYNFQSLRTELMRRGHKFKSTTDTEVIVHLYEEKGADCVRELSGMFAFAIWDVRLRRLFLARDRIGIKPLFYHMDHRCFRFGSEIKSIIADPSMTRSIDAQGLRDFLTLNYVLAPETLFSGVKQILPAHCAVLEDGAWREWRYWDIDFPEKFEKNSEEAWSDGLAEVISRSVKRHMVADVPFGALLSGGIDSSAMVSFMAQHTTEPVETFSIGFSESSYNELEHAGLVAAHYGTNHHEQIIKPEMVEILPRLVWHSEEPLADPSAVPMYYLAQMVQSHVKMAIGGDGADELMAGYETYQADIGARLYRRLPQVFRQYMIEPLVNMLPPSYENYSFEMKAKRFIRAAGNSAEDAHVSWRMIFDESSRRSLQMERSSTASVCQRYEPYFSRVENADFLNRMLYVDTCLHLPNDILTKVDRMSMAHGLEVRVPFLDPEVVEYTASMPVAFKLRNFRHKKFLLKKAMKDRLPRSILERPKAGFNIPLGKWLRGELSDFIGDLLTPQQIDRQGLFDKKIIERLLTEHRKGMRDNGYELWSLTILMIWWKMFISREISPPVMRNANHGIRKIGE